MRGYLGNQTRSRPKQSAKSKNSGGQGGRRRRRKRESDEYPDDEGSLEVISPDQLELWCWGASLLLLGALAVALGARPWRRWNRARRGPRRAWIAPALGALVLLGWQLLLLRRMWRQIVHEPELLDSPRGMWMDIATHLDRLQRRDRKRKKRLQKVTRRFQDAADANPE